MDINNLDSLLNIPAGAVGRCKAEIVLEAREGDTGGGGERLSKPITLHTD